MRAVLALLFIGLVLTHESGPATLKLTVESNVRISDGAPHVEPFIVAHPNTPTVLVVGASEVIDGKGVSATTFRSLDGGRNWARVPLADMRDAIDRGDHRHGIDVWMAYSPSGQLYLAALCGVSQAGKWNVPAVVYRSSDNGESWSRPTSIGGVSFDQPKLATKGEDLYLIAYARLGSPPPGTQPVSVLLSTDRGRSFRHVSSIIPDNLGRSPRAPLVLADGTLFVSYVDYATGPTRAPTRSRLYSALGADAPSVPRFIADTPAGADGASFAIDRSEGPHHGRVFASFTGGDLGFTMAETDGKLQFREEGRRRDVRLVFSDDGGLSWSSPRMLTEEGKSSLTALAVAPDGTVGLVWLQHETPPNERCWNLMFAASGDGAESFGPSVRVSDAISCPDGTLNRATLVCDGRRSIDDEVKGDGERSVTWVADKRSQCRLRTSRFSGPSLLEFRRLLHPRHARGRSNVSFRLRLAPACSAGRPLGSRG